MTTIAAGRPFLSVLAGRLWREADGDATRLADTTVLLPTRRAVRGLRDAFLAAAGGRAVLLPRLISLGDLDADDLAIEATPLIGGGAEVLAALAAIPEAMAPLRRRFLLARLIRAGREGTGGAAVGLAQALDLAEALGRLIDQAHTEGVGFDRLATLAPDSLADHWRITVDFLALVTDHWPRILAEAGVIDAADRRGRLLRAQAALWRAAPPERPVIAAGSTGSIPATAELLAAVAGLARGLVILPGLDRDLDDAAWDDLDESHPQFNMKRLLDRIGLARRQVAEFAPDPDAPADAPARRRLVSEVMRPAITSAAWRQDTRLPPTAAAGITLAVADGPQAEATLIALALRRALDQAETTAMVVTPDRGLARRLAAGLRRWGVTAADSGGTPLAQTQAGAFLRLIARVSAAPTAPGLMAVLQHPLCRIGRTPAAHKRLIRALEARVLRRARGPVTRDGVLGALDALAPAAPAGDQLRAFACQVFDALDPAMDPSPGLGLVERLRRHVAAAESLARGDGVAGADRLWHHADGEAAAALTAGILEHGAVLDQATAPLGPAGYAAVLDVLMAGQVVRPDYGEDPRVSILGPLEARLLSADLVILAGLNEGVWPAAPAPDPWMSRPMRAAMGLPLPERRLGLAAHDMAQLLAGPRVLITRAARQDGVPTIASRWLMRLEAVLDATGLRPLAGDACLAGTAQALDRPAAIRPIDRPAPSPPVWARPASVSVSDVGLVYTDPYQLYARKILGLKLLDPLDAVPDAAERGTLVHDCLEAFLRGRLGHMPPVTDPDAALGELLDLGRRHFAGLAAYPDQFAVHWPRFTAVARFMIERLATADRATVGLEVDGAIRFGPGDGLSLTARADRIDRDRAGRLVIVDYKTGSVPSAADVGRGYAPQLPLEALIAEAGGFADLGAGPHAIGGLEYWRLTGGRVPGTIHPVPKAPEDPAALIGQARTGLGPLAAWLLDPETRFECRPRPSAEPRYSDYQHLSRVAEWSAAGATPSLEDPE